MNKILIVLKLCISSAGGVVINFLTLSFIAGAISKTDYGNFSTLLVISNLLVPIIGFGIAQYWLRANAITYNNYLTSIAPSFNLILVFYFCLLAILILIILVFGQNLELILLFSLHILGLVSIELLIAHNQVKSRFELIAIYQIVPNIFRMLLIFSFYYVSYDFSLNYVIYSYFIVALCIVIYCYYYFSGVTKLNLNYKGKLNYRVIVKEAYPFALMGFLYLVYYQSDVIFLRAMLDEEAAAVYSVAVSIITFVYIIPGVIYQKFLLAQIHVLMEKEQSQVKLKVMYLKSILLMLLLSLFVSFFVYLSLPLILKLFFDKYAEDAIYISKVMILTIPLVFVMQASGVLLNTKGKAKYKLLVMFLSAILNVVLNFFLIERYEILGAVYSTIITYFALCISYYAMSVKVFFSGESIC